MKRTRLFALIAAALSAFAINRHLDINGLLTAFILTGVYYLYRKGIPETTKLTKISSLVLGGVFAMFYTLADMRLMLGIPNSALILTAFFLGFWLFFSFILVNIYAALRNVNFTLCSTGEITTKGKYLVLSGTFILVFAYFAFWLMLQFPANMSIDSFDQLKQAVGIDTLSNHHPIVSTMLIRFWYNIGLKIFNGNQNNAIALYSIFQMFVMALCFAFFFETLYISKVSKKYVSAAIAGFFIVGYHGAYSVTVWKDVLSGGLTLLLCCVIWRFLLFYSEHHGRTPVFETILFVIVGILFCLFRSNAFYAFIVCIPFFTIYFIKKMPEIPVLSVVIVAAVIIIKGPVYSSLGIRPPDTIEALSVPVQHISRTIAEGITLSEEEYSLLSNVVDVEEIPKRYDGHCSDNIKNLVRETDNQEYIKENKLSFIKLWLSMGLKHPICYMWAQIDLTSGYWDPDNRSWYIATEIFALPEVLEMFDIYKEPILPENVVYFFKNLRLSYFSRPVIRLVLNIGLSTWLVFALFGLCIVKKQYQTMLVFAPVLAMILTIFIATPINAEFRYYYGIFTTLPLLVFVPFINSDSKQADQIQ